MTLAGLDSPVRTFFEQLEPLAGDSPDMPAIASLLTEFSRDRDYLQHHIDAMGERSGARPLHMPERGPRLMLVHRLDGQMGAIHSHKVWIAITPIVGVETHRRYDLESRDATSGTARLSLAEELHVDPAEAVTLTPPDDIHAHGHVQGLGDAAYIFVLAGDDQRLYEREQYDLKTNTYRVLAPGDAGDWLEPNP